MNIEVTAEIPCCLTGSRDVLIVSDRDRYGRDLRTVICKSSGLVYTDPRPTESEIQEFYSERYRKDYKGTVTPKPKHVLRAGRLAKNRLDEISALLRPGASILDIGSGGGEFVYTCKNHGFDAHGIEPNKGYANFSVEEYGVDVDCTFFNEVNFDSESFDCITMFHVLEHLEEPVETIRKLADFLRPRGHLVIDVPNVDYTDSAPQQKWHVGHLYHFNIQTLQAAGMKAGLRPIRCFYGGHGSSLFAVFAKIPGPIHCSMEEMLEGSYESTFEILQRHTSLNHFLHFHNPLRRSVSKVYRTLGEKISVRNRLNPREILDALLEKVNPSSATA